MYAIVSGPVHSQKTKIKTKTKTQTKKRQKITTTTKTKHKKEAMRHSESFRRVVRARGLQEMLCVRS
jgi:ribosomal protein L35